MQKKVLSEQGIYFGEVKMPKGFDINRFDLILSGFSSLLKNEKIKFSKSFDQLNKYIIDHIRLNYNVNLVNQDTWFDMFSSNEKTDPLLNVDPVDLRNSPDYTLLYGLGTSNCHVRVYFDDNRRKGRSYDMELENNHFILFPSNNMYVINNKQEDTLNFVQTITYEYI
tara:strand:+ start:1564 stop:2067 length:504 start_codon:yes stop_codon:yes gene_type:complete